MPVYTLRGVQVDFPFSAYDCQLVYMERVIQALQTVSPTLSDWHFSWQSCVFCQLKRTARPSLRTQESAESMGLHQQHPAAAKKSHLPSSFHPHSWRERWRSW